MLMRRICPGFPVVLHTGYLDTPSDEKLEAAGIGMRVIKAATMQELAAVVQETQRRWSKNGDKP